MVIMYVWSVQNALTRTILPGIKITFAQTLLHADMSRPSTDILCW